MLSRTKIRSLPRRGHISGFSLLELAVVAGCAIVITAIALPYYSSLTRNYNIRNDADKILAQLNLARMRAAADFARVQFSCSNTTNTCTLSTKQYPGTSGYTTESSQAVLLSEGNSFGTPVGITAGAGGQSGETPYEGSGAQSISYTVVFNSRGLPINDSTGSSVSDYAFYLLGPNNICMAVAVDVSGRPSVYSLSGSTWVLDH